MRLFWFFVKISVINAFISMQEILSHARALNKTQKKLAHRGFRFQLAKEFTGTFTARQTTGRQSRVESIARYIERHFPKEFDSTAESVHCSNRMW